MSLLEMIVAVGLMSIVFLVFAMMQSQQLKQIKFLEMKQESIDVKNQLFQLLSNPTVDCFAANVVRGDLTFPTTPVPATLNFSKVLYPDNSELGNTTTGLTNSSLLNIQSMAFEQIAGSGNSYTASLKVTLAPKDSTQMVPKPVVVGGINITTQNSPTNPGVKQILSCLTSSPVMMRDLIFGGAFGAGDASYINPMTGNKTCAVGYSTIKVMGWPDGASGDYDLHFCYRDTRDTSSLPPATFYAYGGTYGDSPEGHPNPYTGGMSCPAGYNRQKVMGRTGVDWGLWFCYKNLGATPPDDTNSKRFGGFFATNPWLTVNNPVTGSYSCPSGYTTDQSYGEYNKDWPLFTCVVP